jgi:hypothetical protein
LQDPNHKGKRLLAALRAQLSQLLGRDLQPGEVLLSKAHILAACQNQPDLHIIARILEDNVDAQAVVLKDVLLSMRRLQQRLREVGHHVDAAVLEVLGEADMAWDMSGLTQEVRSARLNRLQRVLTTVQLQRIRSCKGMGRGHVAGFPRDLLWVMAQNVAMRQQLIRQHPTLARYLNERALSQDDVELEFSSLVFLAGYKPEVETALSRLRSADTLAAVRSDPAAPIHILTSTKATYTYNERAEQRQGQDAWNDGRRLPAAAQDEELAGRVRKAQAALPGANCSVRSNHVHGSYGHRMQGG